MEILPDGVDYDGFQPVKSELQLLEECFEGIGRPLGENAPLSFFQAIDRMFPNQYAVYMGKGMGDIAAGALAAGFASAVMVFYIYT